MIVLANGCFDPLHYGHLLHLEAARAMGGALVVALTADAVVRREKGAGRPLFGALERFRMLCALRCVDRVVIVPGVMAALEIVRPAVFVKGSDYVGRVDAEVVAHCARHGIEIRFTNTPKWSATEVGRELCGA